MLMEKLIKYFVEKAWHTDVFQAAITEKIKKAPIVWVWSNLNLVLSTVGEYTILHSPKHGVPFTFETEEDVRNQVKEWDKVINKYEAAETPTKPKRHYNRKNKENKA